MAFIIKLKCDSCKNIFDVDLEDLDLFWEVIDTEERQMGVDIHHQAVVACDCPNCSENISITLDVWEYPIGILNLEEVNAEGATIVEKCSFSGLAPIGE